MTEAAGSREDMIRQGPTQRCPFAVLLEGLTAWRKAGAVSPRQKAGGEGQGSGMDGRGRDLKTQGRAATGNPGSLNSRRKKNTVSYGWEGSGKGREG